MSALTVLRIGLVVWIAWHAIFGLFSTFAPQTGADIVGWNPAGGWNSELLAMSKQYGMVMLLLAGVFLVMLIDPVRYIALIWIGIAEQALGIAYGTYIFSMIGQLSVPQLIAQTATNLALISGMLVLWNRLKPSALAAQRILNT